MYQCRQCKKNANRPHICIEAQQRGDENRCCSDPNICLSLREVADKAAQQLGQNSSEPYLQALFNSKEVDLD